MNSNKLMGSILLAICLLLYGMELFLGEVNIWVFSHIYILILLIESIKKGKRNSSSASVINGISTQSFKYIMIGVGVVMIIIYAYLSFYVSG